MTWKNLKHQVKDYILPDPNDMIFLKGQGYGGSETEGCMLHGAAAARVDMHVSEHAK